MLIGVQSSKKKLLQLKIEDLRRISEYWKHMKCDRTYVWGKEKSKCNQAKKKALPLPDENEITTEEELELYKKKIGSYIKNYYWWEENVWNNGDKGKSWYEYTKEKYLKGNEEKKKEFGEYIIYFFWHAYASKKRNPPEWWVHEDIYNFVKMLVNYEYGEFNTLKKFITTKKLVHLSHKKY